MKTRLALSILVVAAVAGCRTKPLRPEREPPPVEAQPTGSCVLDDRGGVCTAGGCTLVVPTGLLHTPTPIEIGRVPIPPAITGEVFGDIACELGPPSLELDAPARLTLEVSPPPGAFTREDAVAVFVDGAELSLAPDTQVQPGGDGVSLSVDGAAVVALSFLSARVRAVSEISATAAAVESRADRLRVLASRSFTAVFHDGTRLYLGHGDRVLVYESGIPEDPITLPDVVVGAPGFTGVARRPSAADLDAGVVGLWSDGRRLAVASGNRVLLWNQIPTADHVPADLVLGQANFSDNAPNRGQGRPGPDTLAAPNQIASDGDRFVVADSANHRFLVWERFPTFVGQAADVVVGQTDFDERAVRGGALPLFQARGVHIEASRDLYASTFGANCVFAVNRPFRSSNPSFDLCVGTRRYTTRVGPLELSGLGALSAYDALGLAARDFTGRRVNVWRTSPSEAVDAPHFVLGQPSPEVGGATTGLNGSAMISKDVFGGLFGDRERLLVPEERRLLVFEPLPTYGYAPATKVFGQGSFAAFEPAADYDALAGDSLARPGGLAVSPEGILAVADTANDRVLLLSEGRSVALGQPDLESFGPNRFASVSAATLRSPEAVRFAAGRLVVADTGNHRVLVWETVPSSNGTPADRVIGQPSFASGEPNHGLDDADGDGVVDADGAGLFYPSGLAARGRDLYVADRYNHRVLRFDLAAGGDAREVIGQEGLRSNLPNRGAGLLRPSERGLAGPSGLELDSAGRLYVADTLNDRVLRFPASRRPSDLPEVLAQDDLRSVRAPTFNPSAPGYPLEDEQKVASASTLRRPGSIEILGGRLFVADTGNHRVLGFELDGFGPDGRASVVIGQGSFETRDADAFGPDRRSLQGPQGLAALDGRLLVSDRENHRVLGFELSGLPERAAGAARVIGQPDFLETGFNRSLGNRRSISDPAAVAVTGDLTWVTDANRHRVLGFRDGEAVTVLGQPNLTRTLPNRGGAVGPGTLRKPTGIATDGQRLVVADTDNHRVLVWSRVPELTGTPADLVIGQADLRSAEPNRGRPVTSPTASSLRFPQGVALEGARLFVADAGNNRVLSFDALPTRDGAEATGVLCQSSFRANLPNRGGAGARPDSCYAPSDVTPIPGGLAVADTLNDRVLVFSPSGSDGRPAERAVGQPDLESRGAAEPDARSLSGPIAVTSDGVNLLVSDRGHNRILSFYLPELATGMPARQVIGQPSFETSAPARGPVGASRPGGLWVERLSFIESRLTWADTGNGRVVVVAGVRR